MRNLKYFLLVVVPIVTNLILLGCRSDSNPANDSGSSTTGSIALPQTGQTICKDEIGTTIDCAGSGQDGELRTGVSWPNPRFAGDATGGCVIDNLTGLTWAKERAAGAYTWQAALDYVNNLELCGTTDWRLPNRKELRTLINTGANINSAVWLADQGFLNVYPGNHWTSTMVAGNPTEAWMMVGINGTLYPEVKSAQNAVWPVRGGL